MTDEEMQTDDVELVEAEDTEQDSDSSPEAGDGGEPESSQPSKIEFSQEQQAVFNEVVGSKVKMAREFERRALEAEKQLTQFQQATQKQRPTVPSLPDPYDDDYDQKIQARDKALLEVAKWETQQESENRRRLEQSHAAQQQAAKQQYEMVSSYTDRAAKLGVKPERLQQAAQVISNYGMNDDLASYILTDDKGPLITMHIAQNPMLLDQLRNMSPALAAVHIATVIKPSLSGAKKDSAPPPPDALGRGGAPARERGPKGARFE